MKPNPKIIEKCFRITSADGLDFTVYTSTAGKAKYKAFLDMEWDDPKDMLTLRARRAPEMDLMENTPHELLVRLTKLHLYKMKHALGLNNTMESYRNRYVTNFDEDWEDLIKLGLADKSNMNVMHENVYWVTDLGKAVVESTLPILRHKLKK